MAETGSGAPHPARDDTPSPRPRPFPSEATIWTAGFVLLGLAARTVRWRGDTPLWGDEAAVALNLLDRGYRALAGALDLGQVAPLGFLWIERTLLLGLGPSEAALRLAAFVAGAASVLCFCWLGHLLFAVPLHLRGRPTAEGLGEPVPHLELTSVLPLAIFAVAYYPIRYSAELKPYALDLLGACLLQGLATRWLLSARPRRSAPLWVLAAVALAAPWLSYPSGLVGGGIALALLPSVWRDRPRRALPAYVAFVTALATGFVSSYALVGHAQTLALDGSGAWLARFWSDSFPPAGPLPFLSWLARTHTGMMFAYPNGGPSGGSVLTLLLFLIGIATIARPAATGRGALPARGGDVRCGVLGVMLGPFALAFLAACLRLYPYGGSTRTSLYLAPAICLLTGIGAGTLLGLFATSARRARAARVLLGALVVLGAGTVVRDLNAPAGTRDAVTEGRRIAAGLASEAASACIVGLNPAHDLVIPREGPNGPQVSFRWYLRLAAGARWSEADVASAACRGRDRIRAVLFVDRGRPEPAARIGDWERRVDLHVLGERVACTTADCHETVHVRDYLRADASDGAR